MESGGCLLAGRCLGVALHVEGDPLDAVLAGSAPIGARLSLAVTAVAALDGVVEVAGRVPQVHTDHAVVLYPATAAVLSLHAGGLVSLFVRARLIDDAHAVRMVETRIQY